MRKFRPVAVCAAFLALSFVPGSSADPVTRDRLSKYFGGWFSVCPGTSISTTEAPDIAVPGYPAYRVERHCDLKNREETAITLVDPGKDELFVGQVFYAEDRRGHTFAAASDLPNIQTALQDAFGLPVAVRLEPGSRGALLPIRASIREAPEASASLAGFVSGDGAALLLGEFHPFGVSPEAWRERALAAAPGVRTSKGRFLVSAFIDFQCEKCRVRTPQVREFVAAHGGALDVRFLPLVKVHNWSFAAAERAAALAASSPALYAKYEETVFPRAGSMNEKAATDLAADIADAAGVREAFEAELSSGRARERVLRDIELAMRLGSFGTPVFFYQGTYLTSEPSLAETFIQSRQSGAAGSGSHTGAPR